MTLSIRRQNRSRSQSLTGDETMTVQNKYLLIRICNAIAFLLTPVIIFTPYRRLERSTTKKRMSSEDDCKTFKIFHEIKALLDEGHFFNVDSSEYSCRVAFGGFVLVIWVANRPYADMDVTILCAYDSNRNQVRNQVINPVAELNRAPSFATAWYMRRIVDRLRKMNELSTNHRIRGIVQKTISDITLDDVDAMAAMERLTVL